ncbi:MAG: PIN domain-containing protein, partial [Planctomycetes bacterium]|nr:PIN domain-containing protein [Planctomycetota bacterium]
VYERLKEAERGRETLFIPLIVLIETIWVLESGYGKSREAVVGSVEDLLRMPIFEVEKREAVERMVINSEDYPADLADLLIAHSAQLSGCEGGISLDKKACGLPFFELLQKL